MQELLQGIEPTEREKVERMSLSQITDRAIALLREHEPFGAAYYLADSFGKDSSVCLRLAEMSGVRFEAVHSFTTIDPPELLRFGRTHHPNTKILRPQMNMMRRVAEKSAAPPTRTVRWCCEEYKEHDGNGRVKIIGVRAAESAARARWREISKHRDGNKAVCPIVLWSDDQLWAFIRANKIPYCELYDQGWTRLGCVGCPLNNGSRVKEFARWPAYERNWKWAVTENWQRWKDVPKGDGTPRFQAKFKTAEEFWLWWMQDHTPDAFREDCQMHLLLTNQ